MSSTRFFRFPWAASGDKTAIPDTAPPSGAVSYPQGFGPDYERDPATDPLAKRVPRDETNQLYHDITANLRAWQVGALPEWVEAAQNGGTAVTYPVGSLVRHDQSGAFLNYVANVETDEEPGTGADWSVVFGSPGMVAYQSVTDIRNDPPAAPAVGDAYIVGNVPTGAWVDQDNAIAFWNGTSWTFTAPTPWMLVGLANRTDWRWDHTLATPAWVLDPNSLRSDGLKAYFRIVKVLNDAADPIQPVPHGVWTNLTGFNTIEHNNLTSSQIVGPQITIGDEDAGLWLLGMAVNLVNEEDEGQRILVNGMQVISYRAGVGTFGTAPICLGFWPLAKDDIVTFQVWHRTTDQSNFVTGGNVSGSNAIDCDINAGVIFGCKV